MNLICFLLIYRIEFDFVSSLFLVNSIWFTDKLHSWNDVLEVMNEFVSCMSSFINI